MCLKWTFTIKALTSLFYFQSCAEQIKKATVDEVGLFQNIDVPDCYSVVDSLLYFTILY